jgi:hypothetical protein
MVKIVKGFVKPVPVCIKCNKAHPVMVHLGALRLCPSCHKEEFDSRLEVSINDPVFVHWMNIYLALSQVKTS